MPKSNLKLAVAPPSARSTARDELAAAIDERATATARLERVKKAEDALNSKIYAAIPAIEAAEARVVEAKEKAPAFIVAQLARQTMRTRPSRQSKPKPNCSWRRTTWRICVVRASR
jgi:hypothetical protein